MSKNKKIWILSVIVLLIIGIGGILISMKNAPLKINENKTASIIVKNGTTGESIVIEDITEISQIISMINDLGLTRDSKVEEHTGWSILLDVYSESESNKFSRYSLRDNGIEYNGYLYTNGTTIELLEYFSNMFD